MSKDKLAIGKAMRSVAEALSHLNDVSAPMTAFRFPDADDKFGIWVYGCSKVVGEDGDHILMDLTIYYTDPENGVEVYPIVLPNIEVDSFKWYASTNLCAGYGFIEFKVGPYTRQISFSKVDESSDIFTSTSYDREFVYKEVRNTLTTAQRYLHNNSRLVKKLNLINRLPVLRNIRAYGPVFAHSSTTSHSVVGSYKLVPVLVCGGENKDEVIDFLFTAVEVSNYMDRVTIATKAYAFKVHNCKFYFATGDVGINSLESMGIGKRSLTVKGRDDKLALTVKYDPIDNFESIKKSSKACNKNESESSSVPESNKPKSWMMRMNPVQYTVDELEEAFAFWAKEPTSFNYHHRDVLFVCGKFSYVDCNGEGNLELYYIDSKYDAYTVCCAVFPGVSANRIMVLRDKVGNPKGFVASYIEPGEPTPDPMHAEFSFRFNKVDPDDEDVVDAYTGCYKEAIDLFNTSAARFKHFIGTWSLINNMKPVESVNVHNHYDWKMTDPTRPFDLAPMTGYGYKLVPELMFRGDDHVKFIINFVPIPDDTDPLWTDELIVAHLRIAARREKASTVWFSPNGLNTIMTSANGITVHYNRQSLLKLSYNSKVMYSGKSSSTAVVDDYVKDQRWKKDHLNAHDKYAEYEKVYGAKNYKLFKRDDGDEKNSKEKELHHLRYTKWWIRSNGERDKVTEDRTFDVINAQLDPEGYFHVWYLPKKSDITDHFMRDYRGYVVALDDYVNKWIFVNFTTRELVEYHLY